MELEYISQKNKMRIEQEQKRQVKGPKDYSNLELSPNVINIQTITGKFGHHDDEQEEDISP
jgi:hypothetical protein